MSDTTIFKNATMVLPTEVVSGSLNVVNGKIAAVDSGTLALPGGIDLEGDWLLPGLVEVHTDNFERHLMPRPKVQWGALPALLAHDAEVAAAGITTVFDALGVGEADADNLRGRAWDEVVSTLDHCIRRDLLRVDHHLHVRCELPAPNTIDLFAPFHEHPRLALISLMDHTPGQRQWENIDLARTFYVGRKNWTLEKFERQVAHAANLQVRYAEPHRRWFVDYCRTHNIPLASHDDTTVAHVEQAWAEGATMAEFPTTLAAARAAIQRGMATIMGGPNVVRGGSHSGNVAAADLARAGLLTILSSDYVPASLLAAATRLADEGLMSLPQAIATVSWQPAQAAGLTDRGALTAGLRADLLQVRMEALPDGSRHAVVRALWRGGVRAL